MSSSYGPIVRFKQLTRNMQNGFWQYYIRKGRSRVETRSRCPCVVLVLSADSSTHRQRRAERGADFLLGFANGWRFDPTATRFEIKCTPLSLSSPSRISNPHVGAIGLIAGPTIVPHSAVALPPISECLQHRSQTLPLFSELVFKSRWVIAVEPPCDQAVRLHVFQAGR